MGRIIVVDDDPEVVALLLLVFQQEGHTASGFTDARQALEAIRKDPPDLLFVDVVMPGLSGVDLCRMVKSDPDTAPVAVILLSGSSSLRGEVREAGADDGLSKPFDLDAVLRLAAPFVSSIVQSAGS